MRRFRLVMLVMLAMLVVLPFAATPANAQVAVGVGVGPALAYPAYYGPPSCEWGYYAYYPYACAPYGYYGPDWFIGGIFIGAGPWFHGPHGFYGHVDNRFDPHNGYHGPLPERGERAFYHFHGNEARDGRGHVGQANHDAGHEHAGGFQRGGGHPGPHR